MKVKDIDLKQLIETETGEKFNKENKIRSPFSSTDKNPSFGIFPNSNTGKWCFKDFSTGEFGDSIDFIRRYKNMSYKQAREYLGLEVEYSPVEQYEETIKKFIHNQVARGNKKEYKPLGVFVFVDENNKPIYAKVKFLKPDGKKETPYYHIENGQVICNRGIDHDVPYNLYSLLQAIKNNDVIIITEGEKNANRFNMTLKKGYCATSVKGVKNLDDLTYLKGCKIYVCGDTGVPGEAYKQNIYKAFFKEAKEFKFIRLPGLEKLGENMDIDDWMDLGHTKYDLLEAFDKSLDLKNIFELQQDRHGIYKLVKETVGEEEIYKRKYISNFTIVRATTLNYVDDELNNIEITFKDEYGKETKRNGNVAVLEDVRSFKCFLNSMSLTFEGKSDDLIKLKKWINKYFIDDYCEIYNGNQFRKVNNELMFISPSGAIGTNKIYDYIKSNEKANNNILNIEPIGKEELQELMQHLFKFSDYKNSYSIVGITINDLAVYQGIESNTSFPHLLIVGESESGKTTILERVIAQLLNYDKYNIKAMSTTTFAIDKVLSTGNYPALFEEYKHTEFTEIKNKAISDMLRNAYDRRAKERGKKDQSTVTYYYKRPVIMVGEQSYKNSEKALYRRSCIVYVSKNERTEENTKNMDWIKENSLLLNKLGISVLKEILNMSTESYMSIRKEIKSRLSKYDYLIDRPLETVVSACTGIEIINKILSKHNLPIISDYEKYIAGNTENEIIKNEDGAITIYEKLLKEIDRMLTLKPILKDEKYNSHMIYFKDGCTFVRMNLLYAELTKFLAEYKINDYVGFGENDFKKQLEKSGYMEKNDKGKYQFKMRVDKKTVSFLKLNNKKLSELECNELVLDELIAYPIYKEEEKIINMFDKQSNTGH